MFDYARPTSLAETFALLAQEPAARLLMGGTDLLVGLRKGRVRTPLVVDIKRVTDLDGGLTERDGRLRVGARTILTDLVADERVQRWYPALVEAANVVGSIQIRNRATLAGNMGNASPAADTATPLLVYGASVELTRGNGVRRVPLADFLVGPGRTLLEPGELITAIELPVPDEPRGSAFARMTRRRGVDLATVNLCCSVSSAGTTRFGFGAVGPRPFLVTDESGALANAGTEPARQDEMLRDFTGQASPISNVRASREYREAMLLVLARRALANARARLQEARRAGA